MLTITRELLRQHYNYDVGNYHVSTIEGSLVWWKEEDNGNSICYEYNRHYGGTVNGNINTTRKGD